MIREAICEGADVEEALEKAKAELGVTETDEYDFEVIQREEKKKFGLFGGRPAKVRAFIIINEAPEDKTEQFLRDVLDNMGLPDIAIERGTDEGRGRGLRNRQTRRNTRRSAVSCKPCSQPQHRGIC